MASTGRKSTIILDMDETLVHTYHDSMIWKKVKSTTTNYELFHPKGRLPLCYSSIDDDGYCTMWGMYRPGLWEFLIYLEKTFDNVVIWSAGTEDYVNEIIEGIYNHLERKLPNLILTRKHCRIENGQFHKPVIDVKHFTELEELNIDYHPSRTLIVDDREWTFQNNENNGILIPPYNPEDPDNSYDYRVEDSHNVDVKAEDIINFKDSRLYELMNWMQRVRISEQEDFTILNKGNIFQ